jgi:hypothetical protein
MHDAQTDRGNKGRTGGTRDEQGVNRGGDRGNRGTNCSVGCHVMHLCGGGGLQHTQQTHVVLMAVEQCVKQDNIAVLSVLNYCIINTLLIKLMYDVVVSPAAGVSGSSRRGGAEALMAGLGCTHPDSNRWGFRGGRGGRNGKQGNWEGNPNWTGLHRNCVAGGQGGPGNGTAELLKELKVLVLAQARAFDLHNTSCVPLPPQTC